MKFLFSSIGLYPWPATEILKRARNAGFDGVELFLFGKWDREDIVRVQGKADKLGLELHYHQVWSKEESSDEAAATINKGLRFFGQIPRDGYKLRDIIPPVAAPTVIYANYIDQYEEGMWVQTLSTGFQKPRLPFMHFLRDFQRKKFPIVFDTQHYLEYEKESYGVSKLANVDDVFSWQNGWRIFGKSVREVHFNDFDPSKGDKEGRNVFPGTGKAHLSHFVDILREHKWDGYVIPEVRGDVLKSAGGLLALRERMNDYFG